MEALNNNQSLAGIKSLELSKDLNENTDSQLKMYHNKNLLPSKNPLNLDQSRQTNSKEQSL
jgi:hypothetical protein